MALGIGVLRILVHVEIVRISIVRQDVVFLGSPKLLDSQVQFLPMVPILGNRVAPGLLSVLKGSREIPGLEDLLFLLVCDGLPKDLNSREIVGLEPHLPGSIFFENGVLRVFLGTVHEAGNTARFFDQPVIEEKLLLGSQLQDPGSWLRRAAAGPLERPRSMPSGADQRRTSESLSVSFDFS